MYRHPERRYPEPRTDPPPCSATPKQQAFMDRHDLHPDREVDFYEASHTIRQFVDSRRDLLPTDKQVKFLRQRGKWRDGMSRGQAFDVINSIVAMKAGPA
jgi:hypothetical protein